MPVIRELVEELIIVLLVYVNSMEACMKFIMLDVTFHSHDMLLLMHISTTQISLDSCSIPTSIGLRILEIIMHLRYPKFISHTIIWSLFSHTYSD